MRVLTRAVVVALIATMLHGAVPGSGIAPSPASAATPERFAVEGTISTLHPSLIRPEINIPGSGFALSSITSNSPNLDQRVANFGRVAVRITAATSYLWDDGSTVELPDRDKALVLGARVWTFGYMLPLPTSVSVDEAVATTIVIVRGWSVARFSFGLLPLPDDDCGPGCTAETTTGDVTGLRFTYALDPPTIDNSERAMHSFTLDDGAGNTIFGDGYGTNSTIPVLGQAFGLTVHGGTGRFGGVKSGWGYFVTDVVRVPANPNRVEFIFRNF